MLITDHGNLFKIKTTYNPNFRAQVDAIKAIPGWQWDPKNKQWTVPGEHRETVLMLKDTHNAKIEAPENLTPWATGELPPLPDLDFDIPLKADLRPYQRQGIARAIELKRLIIGDEQGLGKTLQSIGTVVGAEAKGEDVFPCLVICPSSTKINWQREWEKFSHKKAMVLTSSHVNTWHLFAETGMAQVFITNYESLKKFFVLDLPKKERLESKDIIMRETINRFKSVIIDEVHRCKDPNTLQSKLCVRVALGKNLRIGLTGTPVVNKPADLWPQLAIIGQLEAVGGKKMYLQRYCEGGKGANNLKELNFVLNMRCFFRREKKDVAKDLPEKQRQTIICEISTRKEYDKAKNDLMNWMKQNGFTDGQINKSMKGEALVRMNALRQISAKGKIEEVKEFTEEVLSSGEKLILFCNLYEIVDSFKRLFPHAVTITGRDSMDQRQRSIDNFQKDPKTNLIICNIQAAGVGITLTASSRVAFIEFPWTYAACVQAEDRAHRIGQKNNVMCTYFLGQDTIDERIYEIIQGKKDIANTITGATDQMEMETVDKVLNLFN